MYQIKVLDIIRGTTVDGPGFRTAIYLSGCNHNCEGCHNPQSWNPDAGRSMTISEIIDIIKEEDFDVTLSGGDPFYFPDKLIQLAKAIKKEGYNLWVYTGYTIEQLINDPKRKLILPYLDAVVDGRFIKSLHDPDLLFRGSSNQRIIYNPSSYNF